MEDEEVEWRSDLIKYNGIHVACIWNIKMYLHLIIPDSELNLFSGKLKQNRGIIYFTSYQMSCQAEDELTDQTPSTSQVWTVWSNTKNPKISTEFQIELLLYVPAVRRTQPITIG